MTDSSSSVTPELQQIAEAKPADDLLDVIVELDQDPASAGSMDEARQSFDRLKAPVGKTIADLGGTVTDAAWINSTLRARVPAKSVTPIGELASVRAVDVPHKLEPESELS
jgi:hypothetical protein